MLATFKESVPPPPPGSPPMLLIHPTLNDRNHIITPRPLYDYYIPGDMGLCQVNVFLKGYLAMCLRTDATMSLISIRITL